MAGDVNLTKTPIVKIENAALESFIDASGFGDFQIVPFERQLIWIRSATANISMMRKGKVLRSAGDFNDYYGYLTSAEAAIKAAIELAHADEIEPGDDLSVVVTLEITDEPAIFDTSSLGMQYMETFPRQIAYQPITFKAGRPQLAYSGTDAMAKWATASLATKLEYYDQVPWIVPKQLVTGLHLWDSSSPKSSDEIATIIAMHRDSALNCVDELLAQKEALLAKSRALALERNA
jgi:hypothetical protein